MVLNCIDGMSNRTEQVFLLTSYVESKNSKTHDKEPLSGEYECRHCNRNDIVVLKLYPTNSVPTDSVN